jgi:RNA polymerase sigma-70 factor (ECF subfamily)
MTGVHRDLEAALVARLRDGDTSAIDEIHAAYHARLFTFLARLSRNRDVAEDLLEETWLRLVRYARKLQPDTALGPWLFAVARNLHVSYCRSRLLETGHAADSIGLWATGVSRPSPFEETAASETERRIEAALASLPAAYREVLLLVGIGGLQPAEAARVCGLTPEALRQRLHRARTLLSERLDTPALPTARVSEVWP